MERLLKRLCLVVLAVAARFTGRRRHGAPIERILIHSGGGIGNTVMATGLIAETRRVFPKARIDLLTTGAAARLLAGLTIVDNIYVIPPNGLAAEWRTIRELRRNRYHVVLMALNAVAFRNVPRIILAGIPERVIHRYALQSYEDFTRLFTKMVPHQTDMHDAEGNLDLLREITEEPVTGVPHQVPVSQEARESARRKLDDLGWREDQYNVTIWPGCRYWARDKRWPLESFQALTERLLNTHATLWIWAICGAEETEEAAFLSNRVHSERFHVVNTLTIDELPAAIERCRLVISNDSLPVHLASALHRPVVAMYGPTDPQRIGPWKTCAEVIVSPSEDAPYFTVPYPPDMANNPECMAQITVDVVVAAAERVLNQAYPCEAAQGSEKRYG